MAGKAETIPVPKAFFEEYVGELSLLEIRVYLLLLMESEHGTRPSIIKVSDKLKTSPDEVFMAIKSLDDKGLVCFNEAAGIDGDIIIKENPVKRVSRNKDTKILDDTEQIKGSPLSASEIDLVFFLKEGLLFSDELVLYLLGYCKRKNAFNKEYIKKVAFSWHKDGVTTVEKARFYCGGNKFNNFEQREYDFKELEKLLLDN